MLVLGVVPYKRTQPLLPDPLQQLERSMEEMKTFVRDEVHTNAPSTVYINSSTPSYFTSFLKAGLLFGATYGLLRLSGVTCTSVQTREQ